MTLTFLLHLSSLFHNQLGRRSVARSERWWACGDGAWFPPAAPPPRFLKYIKTLSFFTKEEHTALQETEVLHENGKTVLPMLR